MKNFKALAMGEANRGKTEMVFDWEKAARLIKERGAKTAEAGLSGDWEWTGGNIWHGGKPNSEDYTYLSSTWAKPEIEIDGDTLECWRFQDETPGWDSDTKWPEQALAILNDLRKEKRDG